MNKQYAKLTERMRQLPVDPYQRMVNQMGSEYANRVVAQQRVADAEQAAEKRVQELKDELEEEKRKIMELEEAMVEEKGSEILWQ